jgi:beta-methylarginine biosynthesis bifunctional aminotransferase
LLRPNPIEKREAAIISNLEKRLTRASAMGGDFVFLQMTAPQNSALQEIALGNPSGSSFSTYAPVLGEDILRNLISLKRTKGVKENCIIVTHGALHSLNLIFRACRKNSPKAVCQAPLYRGVVLALKTNDYDVVLVPESQFLERLPLELARGCKLVVATSPTSPGGRLFTEDELSWILAISQAYGAQVVLDSVYSDFLDISQARTPFRVNPGQLANLFVVDSMSKNYGAAGLRIGWIISNPTQIHEISGLMECDCISVSPITQSIACNLLQSGNKSLVEGVRRRCLDVVPKLNNIFETSIDLPEAGTQLCIHPPFPDVEDFADYALERFRVVFATSDVFIGSPRQFLRFPLSLTERKAEDAVSRIKEVVEGYKCKVKAMR